MKNVDLWRATKYEQTETGYRGSRDKLHLAIPSRLLADLTVAAYSKYLPQYAKGKLADLGCGRVPLYDIYKDHVEEVVCIDWGNSIHAKTHLDFECNLNSDLPLQANSIDTVLLSDVLEHIANPEAFLGHVVKCLKPEGVLMLNVPFAYWLHEEPFDYFRYTQHGLEYLLAKNGFKIKKIITLGSVIEIIVDLLGKFILKNSFLQSIAVYSGQRTNALLRRSSRGEVYLDAISSKMPMGYFVIAIKSV